MEENTVVEAHKLEDYIDLKASCVYTVPPGMRKAGKLAVISEMELNRIRAHAKLWGSDKTNPMPWYLEEMATKHFLFDKYELWDHQIGPKRIHICLVDGIIYEIIEEGLN